MAAGNSIPTIDISPWLNPEATQEARDAVTTAFREACQTYGFMRLVGHNIPLDLQEKVFDCAEEFFALPLDERMDMWIKKSMGQSNRGYEAFQGQQLGTNLMPDMKEGYFVGAEVPKDDPRAGKFLTGPNVWPKSLPKENFEVPLMEYRGKVEELARLVLRILALGLPGSPADIFEGFMKDPSGNLRLLHYPPQLEIDEKQLGAGAHTDFGGITFLLQQPGTSGLEVWYPPTEAWIPVPVQENSYVVNIGDLLQTWTAGFYRSAKHRVINFGEKHRYSAPFFFNGNVDYQFTPLAGGGKPRTVEEHISGKLAASKNKAQILVKEMA